MNILIVIFQLSFTLKTSENSSWNANKKNITAQPDLE